MSGLQVGVTAAPPPFETAMQLAIKPGVMFLQTPSGGVLMDVDGDRFLALTPLSARMWCGLSLGRDPSDVISDISRQRNVSIGRAEGILGAQVKAWERAQLVNPSLMPTQLPQMRSAGASTSVEFPSEATRSASLSPYLIASLHVTELRYKRSLNRLGLSATLRNLQSEGGITRNSQNGILSRSEEKVIARILRNYHALRRAVRQGKDARDCLARSFALAAVLRRNGSDAQLCIGVQDLPFLSHAWVEANGHLLNDPLSIFDQYQVIARF